MSKKYLFLCAGLTAITVVAGVVVLIAFNNPKKELSNDKEKLGEILEADNGKIKTDEYDYDHELNPWGLPVDENGNELTDVKDIMKFNAEHGAPSELTEEMFVGDTLEEQAKIDQYDMNYTGAWMENLFDLYSDMEKDTQYFSSEKFDSNLFAQAAVKYLDEETGYTDGNYGETRYTLSYVDNTYVSDQRFPWFAFYVEELPGKEYRGYYNLQTGEYIVGPGKKLIGY